MGSELREFAGRGARDQLGAGVDAECRQLISKFKQIEQYMEPPFVVETHSQGARRERATTTKLTKTTRLRTERRPRRNRRRLPRRRRDRSRGEGNGRELFDYVLNEGPQGFHVQRYKGLGEMTAPQLWETTMDPERRTLLSVKLEDIAECETIFTTLMGEDVEARRKFIEENALDVKNLDI